MVRLQVYRRTPLREDEYKSKEGTVCCMSYHGLVIPFHWELRAAIHGHVLIETHLLVHF
jgi:hypothetical protein